MTNKVYIYKSRPKARNIRETLKTNNVQYNIAALNAKNAPVGQFYGANNSYAARYFTGKKQGSDCDTYEKDGVVKTGNGKNKSKLKLLGYAATVLGAAALLYEGAYKGLPLLDEKLTNYYRANFNIDNFTSKLGGELKEAIDKTPGLKEFYSSLDGAALRRIKPTQVSADLNDTLFLKGLSTDFSNTTFEAGSDEVRSIAAVISKRNDYLKNDAVSQFARASGFKKAQLPNRAKGIGSTSDKLNNKIKDGHVITSFADAYDLVSDGVGTRAIFKTLTGKEALNALKKSGITDDEITQLKTLWAKNNISGLDESQLKLLSRANNILIEAQTQGTVDKLCSSIANNEITLTKLENYVNEDGVAYFSEKQIKQIYDAWRMSADAKNGAKLFITTRLTPGGELANKLGFSEDYVAQISKKASKPSGYTACQANFTYKNGAHGEGQFRGANIQSFAEYEHYPYDIRKNKNTISEKILKLTQDGKTDVAAQLSEYQDLVKSISDNKEIYGQYNSYFRDVYNYLRKDELGILDIIGRDTLQAPKLHIKELTGYQNELLSKECLESLYNKELYKFQNTP